MNDTNSSSYLMNNYILYLDHEKNYVVIALYVPVFILALVSNILVIAVVIKYHYMRNVTNYFLVNLSVADLLVTIVCMPNAAAQAYTRYWYLGEFTCIAWKYLQCIVVAASVFTITTMALDRYLAITQPFGRSRRFCMNHKTALAVITTLWLASMIIFLPLLFVTELFTPFDNHSFCGEYQWERVEDFYPRSTFGIVCFNLMFAIPGGLMIWAYSMMGRKLCSVRPPSDDNEGSISTQQSFRLMRERKRVALILLLLAFMFAVCWLPYNVVILYMDVSPDSIGKTEKERELLEMVMQYLLLLGHSNSALNPIIYCVMSKNFRKSVKNLLLRTRLNFRSRQTHQLTWYDTSGSSQKMYLPKFYVQHTFNHHHNTLHRVQSSSKNTKTCAV